MPLNIIVGAQWGDEGKGRVVDFLAERADYVARYNGGDNAGHTVSVEGKTFKLHLIPSGIIHPHPIGVIGNGVVVNPATLLSEIDSLRKAGIQVNPDRLRISHAAHIITPAHRALDQAQELARGESKIGTTLRGIGPAYTDKVARRGLRMEAMLAPETFRQAVEAQVDSINWRLANLYEAAPLDAHKIAQEMSEYAQILTEYICEISCELTSAMQSGKTVLAEGAQGTLLDLDHGTYPYVTSCSPTAPGALIGLGLGVGCVERVIGVTKSFQTRVGAGSFPTEVAGETSDRLRGSGENPWDEFGTTTGRPRRVGWLDMVLLRYAARINGFSELALTKLDILSGLDEVQICTAYRYKGQEVTSSPQFCDLPLGPGNLAPYEPVYEALPGWRENITAMRRWEDLPKAARAYILRIEELTGLPVRLISVGPERKQIIEITAQE